MVDFSRYENKVERSATAKYVFEDFEDKTWIEVKRADRTNKLFFNATLKQQTLSPKALRTGKMDIRTVDKSDERNIKLFAKYVVVKWGNMFSGDGKEIKLNEENCTAFLRFLLDQDTENGTTYYLDLKEFAEAPESFDIELPDKEGTGKN